MGPIIDGSLFLVTTISRGPSGLRDSSYSKKSLVREKIIDWYYWAEITAE